MRKEGSQQDLQVHYQEDAVDPGKGGIGAPRPNVVEPVAVRALTVLAFNQNPLHVVLTSLRLQTFQLFSVCLSLFSRTAPRLAGKANAVAFEMMPILLCTVA
jgi:hypothetical protein